MSRNISVDIGLMIYLLISLPLVLPPVVPYLALVVKGSVVEESNLTGVDCGGGTHEAGGGVCGGGTHEPRGGVDGETGKSKL